MNPIRRIKSLLEYPETRGLAIDDPKTTEIRAKIIEKKRFLRRIYEEWYAALASSLPDVSGLVLELGSGPGFMKDVIPDLITSDIQDLDGVDLVLRGHRLPFEENSLRAILMTDVLHHIDQPRLFLREAERCVRSGGIVGMVEPWVTPWSRFVYSKLHHEPFRPDAVDWEFPSSGPLSGANSALPWIMFVRDRTIMEREFPAWEIASISPIMPFRYILSGGVSMRGFMPGWTVGIWRAIERAVSPWINLCAMFAVIILKKRSANP